MDKKNKNPIFSIKNFRSFGEDGADFELAPITVLTGCNSAGKSSLVKALMLLSEMTHHPDRLYVPSLKLYKREYSLGSYDKIIHGEDVSRKIVISYKVWSNLLQDYVNVKRTFGTHKNDVLNDGYLLNMTIEKSNGEIFFDLRKYATIAEEDESLAEFLRRELEIFSITSEYFRCLLDNLKYEKVTNKMSDSKKQEYAANKSKLELITKSIKDKNVNPESFQIEDLRSWGNYIKERETDKEQYLKLLTLNEEEKREFLTIHFPEKELLIEFRGRVVDEVSSPWFLNNTVYIDSSSAFIRRIYSIEDKNKMNSALRTFIESGRADASFEEIYASDSSYYWTGTFLNSWIKRFDLGEFVKIVGDGEGGIKIYLVKNGRDRLLADEGYGVTQLVSLLLNIDINISHNRPQEEGANNLWEDLKTGFANVKGVYRAPYPHRIFCVEEPENHLHPKFQSLLAEMFAEAYQKYNIHFIIETHSEYLIRKLQVMIADKDNTLTSNDVSLNYVEKNEKGVSHNRQIKILEDGRLSEPFGPGFFDESKSLVMKLLKF